MSRRDLPTQLWLIEENVNRNNVPGALRHYDVALRTSLSSHELLFRSSSAFDDDPDTCRADGTAGRRSALSRAIFGALIQQPPSGNNLARLLELIAARGQLSSRDLLASMVIYFGERREYSAAWRIYRVLKNQPRAEPGTLEKRRLRRPQPRAAVRLAARTRDRAGRRDAAGAGAGRGRRPLRLCRQRDERRGRRHLLLLRPGGYTLAAVGGVTAALRPERVTWKTACASTPTAFIATQSAVPSGSGRRRAAARGPGSRSRPPRGTS